MNIWYTYSYVCCKIIGTSVFFLICCRKILSSQCGLPAEDVPSDFRQERQIPFLPHHQWGLFSGAEGFHDSFQWRLITKPPGISITKNLPYHHQKICHVWKVFGFMDSLCFFGQAKMFESFSKLFTDFSSPNGAKAIGIQTGAWGVWKKWTNKIGKGTEAGLLNWAVRPTGPVFLSVSSSVPSLPWKQFFSVSLKKLTSVQYLQWVNSHPKYSRCGPVAKEILQKGDFQTDQIMTLANGFRCSIYISHRIHVWLMYPHLVDFYGGFLKWWYPTTTGFSY